MKSQVANFPILHESAHDMKNTTTHTQSGNDPASLSGIDSSPLAAHPISWPEFGTADPGVAARQDGIEAPTPQGIAARPAVLESSHPLHQLRTSLQVCVGTAKLSVGELLGARAGDVLTLDRALGQDIDLLLDGQLVARGQLVAVDTFFAVRITELAMQAPWPA